MGKGLKFIRDILPEMIPGQESEKGMKTKKEIKEEGKDAYARGVKYKKNPYPSRGHFDQWSSWSDGWLSGEKDQEWRDSE